MNIYKGLGYCFLGPFVLLYIYKFKGSLMKKFEGLSDFFRNATEEEKTEIYLKVIEEANKQQIEIIEEAKEKQEDGIL